jgi:site-specific recombinase XerD
MLNGGWLFPGQHPINPQSTRQLGRACKAAAKDAEIEKRVSMHSYATHLLEAKVDIRVIQTLLGHSKLENTALYAQVATKLLHEVVSPLDALKLIH